jgi:hypothetical protein
LADVKPAALLQFIHQLRHGRAIAPIGIKQRAFEVGTDLNIHRRAD